MDFVDWLIGELNKRDWSNADLARHAEISRTTITNIVKKHRQPGPEVCLAIAKAFKLPPDFVFRKADLLPVEKDQNPTLEEANYLLKQLDNIDQEMIVKIIRTIAEQRGKYDAGDRAIRLDQIN